MRGAVSVGSGVLVRRTCRGARRWCGRGFDSRRLPVSVARPTRRIADSFVAVDQPAPARGVAGTMLTFDEPPLRVIEPTINFDGAE